jgi:hypothetical protein
MVWLLGRGDRCSRAGSSKERPVKGARTDWRIGGLAVKGSEGVTECAGGAAQTVVGERRDGSGGRGS